MNTARLAVVTGASKGIGRGIAVKLASIGYEILVNYGGDRAGAEETVRMISGVGSQAWIFQADVGDRDQMQAMFDFVVDRAGIPDIQVNNAGVQTWKPLLELTDSEWDRTIRTNLKGAFLGTQLAARLMVEHQRKGRIINIGSGCNKVPFPNLVDYTSSKGGIEMLTRVSAVELGPYGITVNCVAPGAIEIERTKEEAHDYAGTWAPLTPCRRVGQVEDVAEAVAYLVSDAAEFVTAQTLYVDGGAFSQGPWPY
ncbi:MAG: SDR family oxidoreductase [Acidobacteriota bacterium]|nr:MAG: SDR family oxidoreductase [Acidobacteriota bacterium]